MDRRSFTRNALVGLGLTLFQPLAARAAKAAVTPPAFAHMPWSGLLDRAKAALDRHQGQFELRDRIAIADFTQASRDMRFHIVDLVSGQSHSYLVAHGRGSDPAHSGWLQRFSNEPNSLASCAGAFKTGEIYDGQHGAAMRLHGLDAQNSNAESRAIVIHGADYVGENQIAAWGKLGRSEGCFALAPHMLPQVLGLLGPGRMLYADKMPSALTQSA